MQITIDTRHDTLEEALAVIQLAFAHQKDLRAEKGTVEPAGPVPVRGRKAGRSGRGRDSRRTARAMNDAVAAPATDDDSARQDAAGIGVSAVALQGAVPPRARASARKAPTKTAESKGATQKAPTKNAPPKKAAVTKASVTKAAVSRSTTKRAPSSKPAASRTTVGSNTAPPGQADLVRAWARDQGMPVKAAGRMPAAVITAYNQAHS